MNKSLWCVIVVSCITVSLTACGEEERQAEKGSDSADTTTLRSGLTCADWGYEEHNGPDKWVEIGCVKCGGEKQSPIDIVTSAVKPEERPDLAITYNPVPLAIYNNGYTVQIQYEGETPSTITVDGETYSLLQIHFHAASEHTIDGKHSPIEMHLVHAHNSLENDLAVIGVMIEEGPEHPAFNPLWASIPDGITEKPVSVEGATVNAMDLLPKGHGYYRYRGGLTNPNAKKPDLSCAEIVKWHVMKQPITLSAEQIGQFTALYDNNYRPTQPLNERAVTASK